MTPAERGIRKIAADILTGFDPVKKNISQRIAKLTLSGHMRRQLIDIAMGVIRNHAAIDMLIEKISGRAAAMIAGKIITPLRIAVYELVFSANSADYAIVNEAVTIAGYTAGKKGAGFVNAVLRKTLSSIKNKTAGFEKSDRLKTIPIDIGLGCEFAFDILPDSAKRPDQYLSEAFSLPLWLTQQWLEEFGFDETFKICLACNRRPSIYARANTLKTSAADLHQKFIAAGLKCGLIEGTGMIKIKNPGNVADLPGFKDGLFVIQDIAAANAVKLLAPQPGDTVLDLCAAPGTKTTQIAEAMGEEGRIIATDINGERLKMVDENIKRLSMTSIETVCYERIAEAATDAGMFNSILIDAPCSNTAVMAKRPEVRYRIKPAQIKTIARTQQQLLERAVEFLKPAGTILYSTCSILRQENSDIVEAFLEKQRDFYMTGQQLTLPSAGDNDCDGGYAAIVSRR